MSHRVTDERLKELERSHRAALGWALDGGTGLNIIADLRDSRREVAALKDQVELGKRLAMLVMGEAYDVQMGDSDGTVGTSDEAVRLAIQIAAAPPGDRT